MCVYARTQNLCSVLWAEGTRRGTQQAAPVVTIDSLTETEHKLQETQLATYNSKDTPPHEHCVGPPSAASAAPASELRKRSRSVSRAPPLFLATYTRHTSLTRRDAPPITIAHPYKSLRNSYLIGGTLPLVTPVIGRSLQKINIRVDAVPADVAQIPYLAMFL